MLSSIDPDTVSKDSCVEGISLKDFDDWNMFEVDLIVHGWSVYECFNTGDYCTFASRMHLT